MAELTEKQIEQYLVRRVKEMGGKAYKFVSPGNDGVPDRLVCLPGGRIGFLELKRPGKTPTALQGAKMTELARLGCRVGFASDKASVDYILALWVGGAAQ